MITLHQHPVWKRVLAYTVLAGIVLFVFGDKVMSDLFRGSNGFDISETSIPADQIFHGGPPKDGIPAIDKPKFVGAKEDTFLQDEDRIMGMSYNGVAKAYPIGILNYHEIVNDKFGDDAIVVSYCPLCGTGMAFSSDIGGKNQSFGVSGLLYNSDVLLYDRETESLWSQILREAVSGPMIGTKLQQLNAAHTTWRDWKERHPETLVLSTDTGYYRDYRHSPYGDYDTNASVYFPVANVDRRYHAKELIIGLDLDGVVKAYPFAELSQYQTPFVEQFAGITITVEFDAANRTGRVLDNEGNEIPTVIAFWFAWTAFHPDTEVFESS